MSEVGLPKPDVVLFFDVNPSVTATRHGFGEEILEKNDFQQSVYVHMNSLFTEPLWQASYLHDFGTT